MSNLPATDLESDINRPDKKQDGGTCELEKIDAGIMAISQALATVERISREKTNPEDTLRLLLSIAAEMNRISITFFQLKEINEKIKAKRIADSKLPK